MNLPYFYSETIPAKELAFDEATSKYIAGVLRMKTGEQLLVTDGKGSKATAIIIDDNRKKCNVQITSVATEEKSSNTTTIAISPVKNASRFEWFLEKATEIGVTDIIPLLCDRSEKERMKTERLKNILVSAMLQSHQHWLPVLHPATLFKNVVELENEQQKFIAHCIEDDKRDLRTIVDHSKSSIILIGPEGDFTPKEIGAASAKGFVAVSLGSTRLRTETAGIVAATLLRI